ncbi:ABC transporter permease [Arcticibacter eurypsychrophilus]|uniref:ABC transporter permease n=1 Tax=Arcticibacter eurypsychrophilus TaxID=1434752 RepID=UPI00084DE483|nr:ABC transporter permease [Arcticibacter eurypsychrophilus]
MIKSYFIIAWRTLFKNRLYSLINIGGLAVGMAVSFMLLLYVYNEFSFDKFNTNAGRLYTVLRNKESNGIINTGRPTPVKLAGVMLKDYPEIEQVARTNWGYPNLVNYNNKALKITTMAADPSLLNMFSFDFISGNKQSALSDPSSIVLTQSGAKAIFGNENPVGRVIKFNDKTPLTVSAIIKDLPGNSTFNFEALIPWSGLEQQQPWIKTAGWGNYSYFTYALLRDGTSVGTLNKKLKGLIGRYDPDNKENSIFLYDFTRMHLYSDFKNGVNTGGAIDYVRLFLFLAIGILAIACINFMNLSTARSARRAREVGVRKVMGADRFTLIQQFMGESLIMALVSFVLAILFMMVLLPYFNSLIHLQLSIPYKNPLAWFAALGVTIATGLLAGSYPAIFLSSFKPVKVLKGQVILTTGTIKPRQVLVVVQFSFAICLIVSSIFIYKQISYIKDQPVGYDRNGLVELTSEGDMLTEFESFRQEAVNAGAIMDGALTSGPITENQSSTWGVEWHGQLPGEDKTTIDQIAVSWHFISTYGLKLIAGRDFDISRPSDSNGVILNLAAVKMMRLKEPIGQQIKWQESQRTVVGVVDNFKWGSPYEPVKPAIIGFMKDWQGNIGLRLNPKQSVSKSLALLKGIYKKHNPNFPFEYKFTDEKFSQKFAQEELLGTMSAGFTCLAVVISCLGLFGLASFSAEQRRKEIGIRKVLGASAGNLWLNLSKEFLGLVCLSFIIGSTISWYYMGQWLAKYTYHTSISIWVFAVTLLLSLLICLITVSWQAIRAVLTNPVKSLRSE